MSPKFLAFTLLVLVSTVLVGAEILDEKQFQKLMKEIGDTNKRFKAGIDGQDSAQVSKDAARISEIYKEMEPFWLKRKSDKAAKWAGDSAGAAALVASSAKAKEWDKVKLHYQDMTKTCKSCHDVHREKLEDGTSRIK